MNGFLEDDTFLKVGHFKSVCNIQTGLQIGI